MPKFRLADTDLTRLTTHAFGGDEPIVLEAGEDFESDDALVVRELRSRPEVDEVTDDA